MVLSREELIYGYWPSRQLGGHIPQAIARPDQYDGSETLSLACTQTALARSDQKKLVKTWCSLLPSLNLKTLVFSSKVSQELFDAATQIKGLEALSIKWSSISSIESIAQSKGLTALYFGSSPAATGLGHLSSLPHLRNLFVQGIPEVQDLSFAQDLNNLVEFGISSSRGRAFTINSLQPLSKLTNLEMIWLVNVRIKNDGLEPLHHLKNLASLRSSFSLDSPDVTSLRSAVPTLKHFQPVWS